MNPWATTLGNHLLCCEQRAHLVHAARAARSGVAGGDHVTHTLVDTAIGGGYLRLLSHHRLRDIYPPVSACDPVAVGRLTMIVLLLRRRLRLVRKMRRGALESARPPCPRAAHSPVVVPSRVPGGEGSPTPRPVAARGGSSAYAILVALPTWNCCHSIFGFKLYVLQQKQQQRKQQLQRAEPRRQKTAVAAATTTALGGTKGAARISPSGRNKRSHRGRG